VLSFRNESGEPVALAPLAFEIDHIPGLELFQVVQTSPTNLRVRLLPAGGAEADRIWMEAQAEIARLLSDHRLGHVTVERAAEPPQQGTGGKFHTVIPFPPAQPARDREERQT
jgi:hypothetical protein